MAGGQGGPRDKQILAALLVRVTCLISSSSVHHEMVSSSRAGAVCDREWASHSGEGTRGGCKAGYQGRRGTLPWERRAHSQQGPAGASSLEPRCLLQKTPLVGLVFSKFSVLVKPASVS